MTGRKTGATEAAQILATHYQDRLWSKVSCRQLV
jgi:hypothetical protein